MPAPKFPRYQDYVIKDGRLIGEFEQMYKDYEDPWHQTNERFSSEKAVALNLLSRLRDQWRIRRVVELGAGFGHFTNRIAQLGFETVGLDISETAVRRGRDCHPGLDLRQAAFSDFDVMKELRPDVIVMAELTWYVLDHLSTFRDFLQAELPRTVLIHLLHTYPPGVQKYGSEYFTDLDGILNFFGMHYLESGMVFMPDGSARTWFLGSWG